MGGRRSRADVKRLEIADGSPTAGGE
jgi:hypothetical protein